MVSVCVGLVLGTVKGLVLTWVSGHGGRGQESTSRVCLGLKAQEKLPLSPEAACSAYRGALPLSCHVHSHVSCPYLHLCCGSVLCGAVTRHIGPIISEQGCGKEGGWQSSFFPEAQATAKSQRSPSLGPWMSPTPSGSSLGYGFFPEQQSSKSSISPPPPVLGGS